MMLNAVIGLGELVYIAFLVLFVGGNYSNNIYGIALLQLK